MDKFLLRFLGLVIFIRILIFILPWFALIVLNPNQSTPNFVEYTAKWNRWDAPHYMHISENGYTNVGDEANFIVFFPLYPMLVGLFNVFVKNSVVTAILISNFLFILGSAFFYKLLEKNYTRKFAARTVLLLCLFPTSYFFSSPYAESLFFCLSVAAWYFAERENFILAGIFAGLSTVTRPFGILLVFSLFFEFLKSERKNIFKFIMIFLPGLVFFSLYLALNYSLFKDPLAFQKILKNNWHKELSLPIKGFISSWNLALSGQINSHTLVVGWGEAITATFAFLFIPLAFKFLKRTWAVYYTLSTVFFTSTSFILSTPRYFLSIPPFFILLNIVIGNKGKKWWIILSIGLLFYLTLIFLSGQWTS